ncbi:ABC transporter substrate-binding protein [Bacillus paralicheniformis]|uniref:ABC transporter substrate-binding protein n=1 Tax=Bacillus paralicheniformis TaxID=1648923 RepID=UPI002867C4AC|nr:ABC transporter substrate-binding protein [Bacillus paralicheniformis]WMW46054.1 ABC transporter substrate-binding protein [Bacillus paralicheniformis]
MKKAIFLIAMFIVILSSCSSQPENSDTSHNKGSQKKEMSYTDDTGHKISFSKTPKKIICLTEICSDTLHELGLKPEAVLEDGLVSQDEFYGKDHQIPLIGGTFYEPNLQNIYQYEPDLVIGLGGVHDNLRDGLGDKAPLFLVNPNHYQDSLSFVETFGSMLGEEKKAKQLTNDIKKKLEQVKKMSPKNKKALVMYGSDINFGIDTQSSIVGSILNEITDYPWKVKGKQEGHNAGGTKYSLEEILKENPDVIFVETFNFGNNKGPSLSEQLANNRIWKRLKAVKNDNVHEVRTSIWANGRGVGSLTIILREAMEQLYPTIDVEKE